MSIATVEEKTKRRLICIDCPFYMKNTPLPNTCKKCGCIISLKTALQNSKCPINKW